MPLTALLAGLLLLLLPFAAPSDSDEGPVVRVAQGELRGLRVQRNENASLRTFYAFRGVPYAQPPVGELRFKDPQEEEPWTGIRNATAPGPHCIQMSPWGVQIVSGEEDCLYLNVFTAHAPETWSSTKRHVLVLIHGGAFLQGNGDMEYMRPDTFLLQGFVIVSMNYRLGAMGFLNTKDDQAPGNAGLKDQTMALRWVQRNIAVFGGNPNLVTIGGQSAGAASVHYHLLSPLSRGLYHRAISMSGSALPSWARVEQPRRKALALRSLFATACNDLAEDAIVSCLQRIDAGELVSNQYIQFLPYQNYSARTAFLPSVEAPSAGSAPFLIAEPELLLKKGRFAHVPYMTGFTSGDGILWILYAQVLQDPSRWEEVDEHFEDIFRWELPPGLRTRGAARQMRQFYLGNRTLIGANQDIDTLERFGQMCTDLYFAAASVRSARLMVERGASVYMYQFSRDGPIGFTKQFYNASFIPGVVHGDDLIYLFEFSNSTNPDADPIPIPASEVLIRDRQVKIFSNMAKTGNPTPEGSGLLHWPLFSSPKESFMDMDVELSVHHPALGRRNAFWRRLYAEYAVVS